MDISTRPQTDVIAPKTRLLLLTVRQAIIMVLGALEDYLGVQRSIIPKHKQ